MTRACHQGRDHPLWHCEAAEIQPLSGPPPVPPPPPPPPPSATYGDTPYNPGVSIDHPLNKSFGDRCGEFFGLNSCGGSGNRQMFQSDHCFDGLISPISNPFFFEDPRDITEIKPLLIYQTSPRNNPVFNGGSGGTGLPGPPGINEQWSVVINKLGFVSMQPRDPNDEFTKSSGFAEFNIGPKWTFYRNEQTTGIAAGGVNFELPIGDKSVYQDTGNLRAGPVFDLCPQLGRLPDGYGIFNVMGEAGYNFGIDNKHPSLPTPASIWITTWPICTSSIH